MYPVLLQAMKEDPPPDAKCRDKFLVQSVLITADKEFTNVGSLVSHLERLQMGPRLIAFIVDAH
jgi:hypothetical protein